MLTEGAVVRSAMTSDDNSDREWEVERPLRMSLRLSALEADVAYFQARLELLGKPRSAHQMAQYAAYRTMEELLRRTLRRLSRRSRPAGERVDSPGD
jgi:hypothetical protein